MLEAGPLKTVAQLTACIVDERKLLVAVATTGNGVS
jgi:hypothetical protein